jgi:hypothetical protein
LDEFSEGGFRQVELLHRGPQREDAKPATCWVGWCARLGNLSRLDARPRSAKLRRGRHRALDMEDARGGSLRIGLTGVEPRDH